MSVIIQMPIPGTAPTADQLGAAAVLLAELRRAGVQVEPYNGRLHILNSRVCALSTNLLERIRELEPVILELFAVTGRVPRCGPSDDDSIPF